MPKKWKGGIHKHPAGWYGFVPRKKQGPGLRKFFSRKYEANAWQHEAGVKEWGLAWPHVKRHGPTTRILPRAKKTAKSEQIEPGIRNEVRYNKARKRFEKKIVVTYMEHATNGKRQRSRSFAYDAVMVERTKDEAIAEAKDVLRKKRAGYSI